MTKEMLIYDDGDSSLTASYNRDIITLREKIRLLDIVNEVHIYVDELDKIVEFVNG